MAISPKITIVDDPGSGIAMVGGGGDDVPDPPAGAGGIPGVPGGDAAPDGPGGDVSSGGGGGDVPCAGVDAFGRKGGVPPSMVPGKARNGCERSAPKVRSWGRMVSSGRALGRGAKVPGGISMLTIGEPPRGDMRSRTVGRTRSRGADLVDRNSPWPRAPGERSSRRARGDVSSAMATLLPSLPAWVMARPPSPNATENRAANAAASRNVPPHLISWPPAG
jgi:hypothetical protein